MRLSLIRCPELMRLFCMFYERRTIWAYWVFFLFFSFLSFFLSFQDAWHGACDGDWRWLPDVLHGHHAHPGPLCQGQCLPGLCTRTRVCVCVCACVVWMVCMLNEKQDGTGSWDLCTGCSEVNCSLCLMSSSDPVWLTGHFQLFAGCSISWHGLGLVNLILTSGGVWITSMILMCWSHSLPAHLISTGSVGATSAGVGVCCPRFAVFPWFASLCYQHDLGVPDITTMVSGRVCSGLHSVLFFLVWKYAWCAWLGCARYNYTIYSKWVSLHLVWLLLVCKHTWSAWSGCATCNCSVRWSLQCSRFAGPPDRHDLVVLGGIAASGRVCSGPRLGSDVTGVKAYLIGMIWVC